MAALALCLVTRGLCWPFPNPSFSSFTWLPEAGSPLADTLCSHLALCFPHLATVAGEPDLELSVSLTLMKNWGPLCPTK